MTTSRTSSDEGHLVITGTGRAGTTLLVQWFTELGFDTGFTPETARRRVNALSNAGLERGLGGRGGHRVPYVTKAPSLMTGLGEALTSGRATVKACIVPMRDLAGAAESRRTASRLAQEQGLDPRSQPGGLAFGAGRNPRRQEERLAVRFHELIHTVARHGIPTYFLAYPEFVRGEQSLYAALRPLLEEHGVTEAEATAAFAAVVDPDLVHDYDINGAG
ncbi:MAG: hypothetical protein CMH83_13175 [Nocardioides sp.]|nr:hypothetical protein [Nocardioides sp.]